MTDSALRPMMEADLERVLAWRNDPEVRRFMYTSHEITPEEHRRWFERVNSQPGVNLLIYEAAGTPQGFMNIHMTQCPRVADWGFYLAPEAPRGSGMALGEAALDYAFTQLNFHKVCGQALGFNERSIRFHEKLGFRREGVLREQHYDGRVYQDVICFGILATEWRNGNG